MLAPIILRVTLAALLLGFAPLTATAQSLPCAPRAQVLDMLARDHQNRRALGQSGEMLMELFAAEPSGRWTLTVTLRDGRTCLLARGAAFEHRDEAFPAAGTAS